MVRKTVLVVAALVFVFVTCTGVVNAQELHQYRWLFHSLSLRDCGG